MEKVLALDFDGVIADTEHECYIISIAAFKRMGEDIDNNPRIRSEFRKARPYVKHADDYFTVLKILQKPDTNFDSISFDTFVKERDKNLEKGKEFHKNFYEERENLQQNMEEWIKLNPQFDNVPEIIKILMKSFSIVIITAKDKRATQILLKSYGINIDDGDILSKEFSMDKRDQMMYIAKKFGVVYEDIVFVEDNLEQLLNVKDMGVNLVMVSWGYSTSEQRKEAQYIGILVTNQENFETLIRSI